MENMIKEVSLLKSKFCEHLETVVYHPQLPSMPSDDQKFGSLLFSFITVENVHIQLYKL